MTKMKKLLLSTVAATALATSANAGIIIGQTSMSTNGSSETETGTTIGITSKSTSEAGALYTGFDLSYTRMDLGGEDEWNDASGDALDFGFRIGMNITSDFSVYGVASVAVQDNASTNDEDNGWSDAAGFGVGFGAQFDITKALALRAEQKSYSMENTAEDWIGNEYTYEYDLDMTTLSLVLTF